VGRGLKLSLAKYRALRGKQPKELGIINGNL